MTTRDVVADIREHADDFLAQRRLTMIIVPSKAFNDMIAFVTPSGRQHCVSVAVPANDQPGWAGAFVSLDPMETTRLGETGWTHVSVGKVDLDSIIGLESYATSEQAVRAVTTMIMAHEDVYTIRDDETLQVCTDDRIVEVCEILQELADAAGDPGTITIGNSFDTGEFVADWLNLTLEDGRSIDVTLGHSSLEIEIGGSFDNPALFRIGDVALFREALSRVDTRLHEKRSAYGGY